MTFLASSNFTWKYLISVSSPSRLWRELFPISAVVLGFLFIEDNSVSAAAAQFKTLVEILTMYFLVFLLKEVLTSTYTDFIVVLRIKQIL